ncbi:cysteine-rich receptor-like protein kinase 10 [Phragmites australis]|uniref:cysteine-rich receptor-like protein kinase 10 n=1 Tax=Phragmites australis TaxID=29695 RepID=UPI002D7A0ECB|nr:cysteine-rich receptor-like protein kinase 10 [Phragmites australis]
MLFTPMQPLLLVVLTAVVLPSTAVAHGCDNHENMTTRVNPLYYDCCAQTRQYKVGDSYYGNLTSLADSLLKSVSAPGTYFASNNVGSVYGFVLCRGDYTGAACADSLNQTIKDAITNRFICPFYKDVTIYYDQLMFSFSGDEFLYNDHSNRPAWVASNMNYVNGTGGAGARYGECVQDLINQTAQLAWNSKLYATGESWFGEEGVSIVYGLVQCRPDPKNDQKDLCRKCLADLVSRIPGKFTTSSGDHRVGGRILGVWCNLRFEKELFFEETKETLKLNMPKRHLTKSEKALIVVATFLSFVILIFLLRWIIERKRESNIQKELEEWTRLLTVEIGSIFSHFTLSEIRNATDNFSEAKKLGEGAFGPVYRGQLTCGVAAIKRLGAYSWQGFEEFRNEIRLIAKLQHLNLVKLIGCCMQHDEKILVYEYMPNRSLDDVFKDVAKWASLTWPIRQNIIDGIAQGLLYIQNYAQPETCIVHRDLKPSNILLDGQMNAKISDFGIARMSSSSTTESQAIIPMGTPGYMAPECFSANSISVKSDVFSFGVLVLEIISGRKVATSFRRYKRSENLIAYAWRLWEDKNCKQLIDNSLSVEEHNQEAEIIRCIQIALLCVQANPEDRPDMKDVVRMLNKDTQLDNPKQPSYFHGPIVGVEVATTINRTRIQTQYYTAIHAHLV